MCANPLMYTILRWKFGPNVPITLQTVYGVWNMDFFRFVMPWFCVNSNQSILSAISCGYISAVWPLFLIILISLAMELHKRNFMLVVYPWWLINQVSSGVIQHRFAQTNLIHTFASFFLLSYLKTIYVSFTLIGPVQLDMEKGTFSKAHLLSFDPQINYLSRDHLVYAVPAILIILMLGVFLPIVLLLYPTRIGTWFGERWRTGRIRNAGKTFIEAFQGCYKDGTNGDRDYRALPGFYLLVRVLFAALFAIRTESSLHSSKNLDLIGILVCLFTTAFYGLAKPYKTKRHNSYDVMLYSKWAALNLIFYVIIRVETYMTSILVTYLVLILLPLTVALLIVLKSCLHGILKM